jgi:hypothetical protein
LAGGTNLADVVLGLAVHLHAHDLVDVQPDAEHACGLAVAVLVHLVLVAVDGGGEAVDGERGARGLHLDVVALVVHNHLQVGWPDDGEARALLGIVQRLVPGAQDGVGVHGCV